MQNQMKKADDAAVGAATRDEQPTATRRRTVTPRCDIRETADAIVVTADMPGVDDASLDITLHKGVLTLRGSVTADAPEGFRLVLGEYEPLDYERSFTLPDAIDQERVAAQPKRIAVRAG